MKTMMVKGLSLVVTLMLTAFAAMASQVEGVWVNRQNDLVIEVEDTYEGIRVRESDERRWRYYERARGAQYQDYNGNNYRVTRSGKLVWTGSRGKRAITFDRYDDGEYGGRSSRYVNDGYDGGYYEDNYDRGYSKRLTRRQMRKWRQLEGRWQSNRGREISVDVTPRGIIVSGQRGNQVFYPRRDGKLYNEAGQCLHMQGGNKIILKNGRRGRDVVYRRARRNAYCE